MKKPPVIWLDIMLLMLAAVAASIDAIGYLALGHVLTANMTGNTVLLGVAVGSGRLLPLSRALTALFSFIAGVAGGTRVIRRWKERLPVLTWSLRIETALVSLLCILWLFRQQPYHAVILYTSITVSAVAMGLQSVTIRYLRIPGVVTTYLTGTITTIISEVTGRLTTDQRFAASSSGAVKPSLEHRIKLQLLIFLTYGGMAAATALIYLLGWHFLPVIPLLFITGAIVILNRHPSRLFITLESEKPLLKPEPGMVTEARAERPGNSQQDQQQGDPEIGE